MLKKSFDRLFPSFDYLSIDYLVSIMNFKTCSYNDNMMKPCGMDVVRLLGEGEKLLKLMPQNIRTEIAFFPPLFCLQYVLEDLL